MGERRLYSCPRAEAKVRPRLLAMVWIRSCCARIEWRHPWMSGNFSVLEPFCIVRRVTEDEATHALALRYCVLDR